MQKQGILLIISGPSGVGKGSVIKKLCCLKGFSVSISATTREKRNLEKDGVDYFFITKEEFKNNIKNKEMLEYNEYCGNFYGTIKNKLLEMLKKNDVVLLEVDVNGALNVSKRLEAVKIFLLPPSFEELEKRLKGRKTETEISLKNRLKNAYFEIEKAKYYDYVLVNQEIEKTVEDVNIIIKSENFRVRRNNSKIEQFLKNEIFGGALWKELLLKEF